MQKETDDFQQLHVTKQQSCNVKEVKPQLFQKMSQPSNDFLFKEANSNAKNQTFNEESLQSDQQEASCASEVSFEDDILESHETALNYEIQKSMSLFTLQNGRHKSKGNLLKIGSFQDNLYKVLLPMPNINFSLVKAFHGYLEQHNTFKQFITHIHFSYQDKISNKLLQFSFMIWCIYRTFLGKGLCNTEIFMIANDLSQKLSANQSIFKICQSQPLKHQKSQIREKFIQFLTTTVILVLQGFFKNPLCYPTHQFEKHVVRSWSQIKQASPFIDQLGLQSRKMIKTDNQ